MKRIIYVADQTKIIKILKKEKINIYDKRYEKYCLFESPNENKLKYKKGDLLSVDFWSKYRILKPIGKLHFTPRERCLDWDLKEKKRLEILGNFLSKLDKNLVNELIDKNEKRQKEFEETYYRCFYQSFKMYYARDYVIDIAKDLISLVEQKKFEHKTNSIEELVGNFKKNKFDMVLEKSLDEVLNTVFAMTQNDATAWYQDSKTLFSSLTLFQEAINFMLRFSKEIIDEKSMISSNEKGFLKWHEAGAMCVWEGFSLIRGADSVKMEEIKRMITIKDKN